MAKVKKQKTAHAGKGHFNVIDALIIVLVISVAVCIYFRASVIDFLWAESRTDDYAISFSIEDIRYTTPNYVNVGDKVYFADNGELFGTFMSESENMNALNIVPASKYFTDTKGNVVEVFYPDGESRVDAKGRIQCKGYYTQDGGFSVDSKKYLAPGQSVKIRTELVILTINITSIEIIPEQ